MNTRISQAFNVLVLRKVVERMHAATRAPADDRFLTKGQQNVQTLRVPVPTQHESLRSRLAGFGRGGILLMEIVFSIGLLAILTVYVSSHVGQTGLEADRQKNDMQAVVTGNNLIEIMIATSSTPLDVVNALLPPPGPDGKIEISPTSPLWSGGTSTSTVQIVKDATNNVSSFTLLINNQESGTKASYWHVFVPPDALNGGTVNFNRPGFVDVAAGYLHTLALKGNGTVLGWGYNPYGESSGEPPDNSFPYKATPYVVKGPNGVDPLSRIIQVETCLYYGSFGLDPEGQIYAWGYNYYGIFGPGTPLGAVQHRPRLIQNLDGQAYSGFKKIAVGYCHVVGLKTDGRLWSWGYNWHGELGNGRYGLTPYPTPIASGGSPLVAGARHSGIIKPDGSVWMWGSNARKQLGKGGAPGNVSNPQQIPDFSGVKELRAGHDFTLALMHDGTVKSWGDNSFAQCGIGNNNPADFHPPTNVVGSQPGKILSNIIAIDAGASHSVALDSWNRVWCWGSNRHGECGQPLTMLTTHTPALAYNPGYNNNGNPATQVAAGGGHSLAMVWTNIWAWGANESGQLGLDPNTFPSLTTPQYITWGNQITAGASFTAVLEGDGQIKVSGANDRGQLGYSSYTSAYRASFDYVRDSAGQVFSAEFIDAGDNWVVAIASGGAIWGWGDNTYGQLGKSPTNLGFSRVPVRIHEPATEDEKPLFVRAGRFHGLAVLQNGTVLSWGNNSAQQLSTGATAWPGPGAISALTGMAQYLTGASDVAAGLHHSMALGADGTLWTWGYNYEGQCGNGQYYQYRQVTPSRVKRSDGIGVLTGIKQVSAGWYSSYAVDTDGKIWSWGHGNNGELGNGSNNYLNPLPVRVRDTSNAANSTLADVKTVIGASYRALAIKQDGTLYGWGGNWDHQIDNALNTLNYPRVVAINQVDHLAGSYYHTVAIRNTAELWTWGRDENYVLGDGLPSGNWTPPTSISFP